MKSKRLGNIDILRGIAALLVVWQHSSGNFGQIPEISIHGTMLLEIALSVDFGRIGVVCFFLISGFVIPFSFTQGPGALKKFCIRRLFRLYPLYWVSVICAATVTFLLTRNAFEMGTVFANLTMLQSAFGEPHIQGLYWTLQAELAFYILCGVIISMGIPNRPGTYLIASLISLCVFVAISIFNLKTRFLENTPNEILIIPYVLAIMFCGTLLRTILDPAASRSNKMILLIGPLAVFGVPLMVFIIYLAGINLVDNPIRFACSHLIGLGLFIAGYIWIKTNNAVLLWLGTISYSVYLFHPIVINLVHIIRLKFSTSGLTSMHMGFYMSIVVVLTIILASITYLLIEKPSINLGYKLSSNRNQKT